jgi:Secretion system C-terminal sorting domain
MKTIFLNVKSLAILLAILFVTNISKAQITITSADMPPIGTKLYYTTSRYDSAFNPGPAGANQTWNISFNSPFVTTSTISILNPSSTSGASSFPSSNFAIKGENSGFTYYEMNADSLVHIGFSSGSGLQTTNFRAKICDFPINYMSQIVNNYSFISTRPSPIVIGDSVVIKETANETYIYDAWGVITTPCGSYNCLRKKLNTIYSDSFFTLSNNITTYDSTWGITKVNTFEWWSDSSKYIIASVYIQDTLNIGSFGLNYQSCFPNAIAQKAITPQISLTPNPAFDKINITISNELLGKNYSIINTLGQIVLKGNFLNTTNTISINALKNDNYILKSDDVENVRIRFCKQ